MLKEGDIVTICDNITCEVVNKDVWFDWIKINGFNPFRVFIANDIHHSTHPDLPKDLRLIFPPISQQ